MSSTKFLKRLGMPNCHYCLSSLQFLMYSYNKETKFLELSTLNKFILQITLESEVHGCNVWFHAVV